MKSCFKLLCKDYIYTELVLCKISILELFCKNNQQLLAANCFRKKAFIINALHGVKYVFACFTVQSIRIQSFMYRYLISSCLANQKVTSLQSLCSISIIKRSQESEAIFLIILLRSSYMLFHLGGKN